MDNKQKKVELSIGDILVSSWGYDQTNIDFYQVIKLTKKMVMVSQVKNRIIENGPNFTGKVEPIKDAFVGAPFKRKIMYYSDAPAISITSYSSARPWGGKPEYFSSYA